MLGASGSVGTGFGSFGEGRGSVDVGRVSVLAGSSVGSAGVVPGDGSEKRVAEGISLSIGAVAVCGVDIFSSFLFLGFE